MADLYKLEKSIKHYEWGSPYLIPRLLGKDNPEKKCWAELWMGVHPGAPSKTSVKGKTVFLSELTELPFLFKFLAAENPLSIQAHPNCAQAMEGFEKENKAGIPPDAAERNYRDPNHKPEIICALTHFTAMAGFRETEETAELLSLVNGTEKVKNALKDGYFSFLTALFALSESERKTLNDSVLSQSQSDDGSFLIRLCGKLAQRYPCDPGIISPLYLNVINLKPFQALYIPAGILHAYIEGFAMECMANSDNVLRGGLTPKHIDIEELLSILSFDPFIPELLKPINISPGCYGYAHNLCKEFSLYLIQNPVSSGDPVLPGEIKLAVPGMGIAAVFDGCAEISINQGSEQKSIVLKKGESAFISRRNGEECLHFSGDCTVFAALVPD